MNLSQSSNKATVKFVFSRQRRKGYTENSSSFSKIFLLHTITLNKEVMNLKMSGEVYVGESRGKKREKPN